MNFNKKDMIYGIAFVVLALGIVLPHGCRITRIEKYIQEVPQTTFKSRYAQGKLNDNFADGKFVTWEEWRHSTDMRIKRLQEKSRGLR